MLDCVLFCGAQVQLAPFLCMVAVYLECYSLIMSVLTREKGEFSVISLWTQQLGLAMLLSWLRSLRL